MGIPYRRFGTNYRSHLKLIKQSILGLLDHRALILYTKPPDTSHFTRFVWTKSFRIS